MSDMSSGTTRGWQVALAGVLRVFGLFGVARRLDGSARSAELHAADERSFVLRVVQPGLAGLMDGSVSTLAPIFTVAFLTNKPFPAFLVGLATATGAGISMAFAEGLSDDGALTGRGNPILRGGVTGVMTFFGGALHTLPFLIPEHPCRADRRVYRRRRRAGRHRRDPPPLLRYELGPFDLAGRRRWRAGLHRRVALWPCLGHGREWSPMRANAAARASGMPHPDRYRGDWRQL